jgi:5-enolpyruvylshikimate-3-phosphate synthase
MNLVSEPEIIINNKEVVEKSYPAFFKDMNVLAGI